MNPEITNETPKRRTLPEAATPYRWKKGGPSSNPGGRPKTAHISQALRAALENGKADELASVGEIPRISMTSELPISLQPSNAAIS